MIFILPIFAGLLMAPDSSNTPQYIFSSKSPAYYQVSLKFDGFVPVFGGQKGDATAKFDLEVKPTAPQTASPDSAKAIITVLASLKSFALSFNGALLPVSLKDALKFFSPTRYSFMPDGSKLTVFGAVKLPPVRLPGLDMAHVPRLSFLPCELPTVAGQLLTYSEPIPGGSENVTVSFHPDATRSGMLDFAIQENSKSTYLQDVADQVVTDRANADAEVKMVDTGKGSGKFDVGKHQFVSFTMTDDIVSTVHSLHDGTVLQHHLKRTVLIQSLDHLPPSKKTFF